MAVNLNDFTALNQKLSSEKQVENAERQLKTDIKQLGLPALRPAVCPSRVTKWVLSQLTRMCRAYLRLYPVVAGLDFYYDVSAIPGLE